MKQLLQSTFVLVALAVLVVLSWVNSCQLDRLEQRVIEAERALSGGSIAVRSGAGAGRADSSSAEDGWEAGAAEKAALADPENLLSPRRRPWAQGDKIVRGGTLRSKMEMDPRGLNPYVANGADVAEYSEYVMNGLADRQPGNPEEFVPALALKVTSPDDGLSYVVHLRQGVYWHKPAVDWESGRYDWLRGEHELTSDDFLFAFEIIQSPQVSGAVSSLRNYFEALDRVEVIDRYTFKVYFKERLYTGRTTLLRGVYPMPRWLYMYDEDGQEFDEATWGLRLNQHWYNQRLIGTGPYRFVDWTPGVKIELERNPRYWGEQATFDRVVMPMVKDQNAWPRKLKTGEIDLTQLQPEQYRTEVLEAEGPLLGSPRIKQKIHETLSYFYIGWNLDTRYFGDKRVRQAMTMALNRPAIIENVFYGLGMIHTGPFAQQQPAYDHRIEPWPYDLEGAAKRLKQAGWEDTDGDGIRDKVIGGKRVPFEFTMLIYGSSSEFQTIASIYREDLLQLGIKLFPRALEWSTMLKKMDEREFDAYSGGWVLGWDTDLMQLWHSKEADRPKSSNRIGFRNKRADEIAQLLRRTFDAKERQKLCHDFHALMHELQPYTFIYQRRRPVLYWDYLNEPEFSLVWPYRDLRRFSFREARP